MLTPLFFYHKKPRVAEPSALLESFQQQLWFSTVVVDAALHVVLGCGLWLTSDAFNNSCPNADGRTHSLPSENAAVSPAPKQEMTLCQNHTNRPRDDKPPAAYDSTF